MICTKLKEIVELHDIEKCDLNYKSKLEKNFNFGKYSQPNVILRDIHEQYLSLEDANNKQVIL